MLQGKELLAEIKRMMEAEAKKHEKKQEVEDVSDKLHENKTSTRQSSARW